MSAPLTADQVHQKRAELAQLVDELRGQLSAAADAARTVELDQTAVGRLSRVDSMQRQAMAQASRRAIEVRIQQCQAALAALDRGDYGICQNCEEPIGDKRLEVRPEAPLCIACQRGADRR